MNELNGMFSVGMSTSGFPDGKPTESEVHSDGRSRHYMPDGRVITVPAKPGYLIHYLSTWAGGADGDTYDIRVCLIGLSSVPGFLEVWNYDIGQMRAYAFDKIVCMNEIDSDKTFDGESIRVQLGGVSRDR